MLSLVQQFHLNMFEAANEILNQAAQNGVAGEVLAAPPIGRIEGQVPVAQENPQFVVHAMPIEQQRLITAQQMGQIGSMPKGPAIDQTGPTNPPLFYRPDKPGSVATRAVNKVCNK